MHDSHFELPGQLLLGLLFLACGVLLILKKYFNKDYLPMIPEQIVITVCIVGSTLGGLYLVISKLWKPSFYFR
jgi:drug/metabolite transporter (DMT)-like permease